MLHALEIWNSTDGYWSIFDDRSISMDVAVLKAKVERLMGREAYEDNRFRIIAIVWEN